MRIGFHSYKGGVGRTKAMVGVGALMALSGHRVGLIDFDLDASGLATIFGDGESVGRNELLHVLKANDTRLALESLKEEDELIEKRFGKNPQDNGGTLKYIPTISDPVLSDEINLSPDMRKDVDRLFEVLVDGTGIDHLLVDVKPGYSPSASLVLPLCNLAVVLTRLDSQNIAGLSRTLPVLVRQKLDPIVVANFLPTDRDEEVEERIALLKKATTFEKSGEKKSCDVSVRIAYDPNLAFDDDFACIAREGTPMNAGLNALSRLIRAKIHPTEAG